MYHELVLQGLFFLAEVARPFCKNSHHTVYRQGFLTSNLTDKIHDIIWDWTNIQRCDSHIFWPFCHPIFQIMVKITKWLFLFRKLWRVSLNKIFPVCNGYGFISLQRIHFRKKSNKIPSKRIGTYNYIATSLSCCWFVLHSDNRHVITFHGLCLLCDNPPQTPPPPFFPLQNVCSRCDLFVFTRLLKSVRGTVCCQVMKG